MQEGVMSTTLTGPRPSLFETATATSASARAGGRPTTLEERLAHTWHELAHAGEADCPMCHTAMRLQAGTGRCTGCGTTLS
jgi:hypothetical protein